MPYNYKEPLEAARTELEGLLNEEGLLERRLRNVRTRTEALRETVLSLSALVGEETEEDSIGSQMLFENFLNGFGHRLSLGYISGRKSFHSENTKTSSP